MMGSNPGINPLFSEQVIHSHCSALKDALKNGSTCENNHIMRKIIPDKNYSICITLQREACIITLSISSYGLVQEYKKADSLRNSSRNSCCFSSKLASLRRMLATSVACSGATCCFTVNATFFVLFHLSGSSCNTNQLSSKDTGHRSNKS